MKRPPLAAVLLAGTVFATLSAQAPLVLRSDARPDWPGIQLLFFELSRGSCVSTADRSDWQAAVGATTPPGGPLSSRVDRGAGCGGGCFDRREGTPSGSDVEVSSASQAVLSPVRGMRR